MLIRGEIVKDRTFIISDPEAVFPTCFKCQDPVIMLSNVCPFFIKIIRILSMQPNRRNVPYTAKNVFLTFQHGTKRNILWGHFNYHHGF